MLWFNLIQAHGCCTYETSTLPLFYVGWLQNTIFTKLHQTGNQRLKQKLVLSAISSLKIIIEHKKNNECYWALAKKETLFATNDWNLSLISFSLSFRLNWSACGRQPPCWGWKTGFLTSHFRVWFPVVYGCRGRGSGGVSVKWSSLV